MRSLILAVLLVLLTAPVGTRAQSTDAPTAGRKEVVWPELPDSPPDAPMARIGFAFDPVSDTNEAAAALKTPVDVYVMAWDVQVGLYCWEAHLTFDPRLTILETEYMADLHLDKDGDVRAMIQPEDCAGSGRTVLARFKVVLLEEEATDLVFGIGPCAQPSRINGATDDTEPTPVYLVCRPGKDVRPFQYSAVSAVLNPVSVHPEFSPKSKPHFVPELGPRH